MRVVAIVQARMGSARLPGKVMRPLAGEPMIRRVVERVRRVPGVDTVLVATTTRQQDGLLVEFLARNGIPFMRGPADDVLARYRDAAEFAAASVIVRVTADCPLISPSVSGRVVGQFLAAAGQYDYASNSLQRTYPRGLDTEVFTAEALWRADRHAVTRPDREHVTSYMYRHPEQFRLLSVTDTVDRHEFRWTVDTPEDFELVRRVYDALYPARPDFEYEDVLALMSAHPEWDELNRRIAQKRYGE